MRLICLLILTQLFSFLAFAKDRATDKQIIEYTKALPVVKLEAGLPSQSFDDWLRSGLPHLDEVLWKSDPGCDLQEAANPSPLCVKFTFRRGSVSGWGLVKVGTIADGVTGTPKLRYLTVLYGEAQVAAGAQQGARYTEQLSDLPQMLDDMARQTRPREK